MGHYLAHFLAFSVTFPRLTHSFPLAVVTLISNAIILPKPVFFKKYQNDEYLKLAILIVNDFFSTKYQESQKSI
jgi:hypothetical protein